MGLAAGLQRRMLVGFLAVLLALYVSAVLTSWGMRSARGEWGSAALCAVGLALALPPPLRSRRYVAAVLCLCAAPIAAMLFHDIDAAQVWAVIPLMFSAIYVRAWHRAAIARAAAVGIAVAACAAMAVAPAVVPAGWYVLFVVCILAAAEIVGVLHATLYEAALRDPLTAAWNRAGVERHAALLLERAARRTEPVAVIALDVDDFKDLNDRAGHAAGDRALAQLVRAWAAHLPNHAIVGRLGGDEFLVVVTGYDERQSAELAGELAAVGPVQVSAGTAVGRQGDEQELAALISRADADLYRVKRERKLRGDARG